MNIETKRLLLREMNMEDYDALFRVLGDPESMWHYPYTFACEYPDEINGKTHVSVISREDWQREIEEYGNGLSIQEIGQ